MLTRKLGPLNDGTRREPLAAVAAAVKCTILVALICGIAWIGGSVPADDENRLLTQAAHLRPAP